MKLCEWGSGKRQKGNIVRGTVCSSARLNQVNVFLGGGPAHTENISWPHRIAWSYKIIISGPRVVRIPAEAVTLVYKEMRPIFPPGNDFPATPSVLKHKPPAQLLPSCAGL